MFGLDSCGVRFAIIGEGKFLRLCVFIFFSVALSNMFMHCGQYAYVMNILYLCRGVRIERIESILNEMQKKKRADEHKKNKKKKKRKDEEIFLLRISKSTSAKDIYVRTVIYSTVGVNCVSAMGCVPLAHPTIMVC